VAVRGLERSLHSDFSALSRRNTMLVQTDLDMVGYRGEAVPAHAKNA